MKENWRKIRSFPGYSVSDWGRIRSDRFDRILALNPNQSGLVYVGMVRDGIQYHRSVPLLVAKAFMPHHSRPFDTPINLDGDRSNNHVFNLEWRPRWFALEYHRQFVFPCQDSIDAPLIDLYTEEICDNSLECAMRYGLLEQDLVEAVFNGTTVWPTHQQFDIYRE